MLNNYMNGYNNMTPQSYSYNQASFGYQQPMQPQMNTGIYTEFRFMSEDEFKAQVVNPNCRLYALDKDKMKLRIKVTDSIGNTTIDNFNLSKDDTINAQAVQQIGLSKDDIKDFITKDDFEAQLSTFKTEMNARLEKLDKSIQIKNILDGGNKNA